MRSEVIERGTDKHLFLIFLGWSSDANCLADIKSQFRDQNVIALWDYNDLNISIDLSVWHTIDVWAWSMGVWAAEMFMSTNSKLHWGERTAICGSARPVDDLYGIPKATVQATLDNWCERSREKFNMRMCGGRSTYNNNIQLMSSRSIESQRSELKTIMDGAQLTANGVWNRAIIGSCDLIFPQENLQRYWNDHAEEVCVVNMPHWPWSSINLFYDKKS